MKWYPAIFSILLLILFSCKGDITEFNLSGKVFMEGEAQENASVTITNLLGFSDTTDINGYYLINAVPEGTRILYAEKTFPNGSFTGKAIELDVSRNIVLDDIHLSRSIEFVSVELDSVNNKAILVWQESDAVDFMEYRVFSHNLPSFEEGSASLLHVASSISDTTFEYIMPSNISMYFRVIVYNEFGKLAGSDIQELTSESLNLLTFGNFEEEDEFFDYWTTLGLCYIQDSVTRVGNSAMLLNSFIDIDNVQWTTCILEHPGIEVEQGQAYELSFWYKVRGYANIQEGPIRYFYIQEELPYINTTIGTTWSGQDVPQTPFRLLNERNWDYHSKVFYPSSDSTIYFHFEGNVDELYVDDLRMIKVIEEEED